MPSVKNVKQQNSYTAVGNTQWKTVLEFFLQSETCAQGRYTVTSSLGLTQEKRKQIFTKRFLHVEFYL